MNDRDEKLRDSLNDSLTAAGIDVRTLAIEVIDGTVRVKGSVPTIEQRDHLARVLGQGVAAGPALDVDVGVQPVAASDSADGRGRSPVTGTSADSAHESRHQLDRD